MIRFSPDANAILSNGIWNDLYRLELKEHARQDWHNEKSHCLTPRPTKQLEWWGLIEWSEKNQRYTRTALGKELSQLFA